MQQCHEGIARGEGGFDFGLPFYRWFNVIVRNEAGNSKAKQRLLERAGKCPIGREMRYEDPEHSSPPEWRVNSGRSGVFDFETNMLRKIEQRLIRRFVQHLQDISVLPPIPFIGSWKRKLFQRQVDKRIFFVRKTTSNFGN